MVKRLFGRFVMGWPSNKPYRDAEILRLTSTGVYNTVPNTAATVPAINADINLFRRVTIIVQFPNFCHRRGPLLVHLLQANKLSPREPVQDFRPLILLIALFISFLARLFYKYLDNFGPILMASKHPL